MAELQDFDYRCYSNDGKLKPDSAVAQWDVQVLEGSHPQDWARAAPGPVAKRVRDSIT